MFQRRCWTAWTATRRSSSSTSTTMTSARCGQDLRHPRPGQGEGRLPGALPDRRAARRWARAHTWSTSRPCAPAAEHRRGVQAAGDRERQDGRGIRERRDGGTLLIGVADDGSVHGLASDYASLHKPGKDDRDLFQLHLAQVLINALGETAASSVSVQLHTVDGQDLCRVHVPPSSFPVEAHVVVDGRASWRRRPPSTSASATGPGRSPTPPNDSDMSHNGGVHAPSTHLELRHGAHSHKPSWPLAGLDREYGLGSRSTQCQ